MNRIGEILAIIGVLALLAYGAVWLASIIGSDGLIVIAGLLLLSFMAMLLAVLAGLEIHRWFHRREYSDLPWDEEFRRFQESFGRQEEE